MANSFLFDMNKCTGCGACRLACTIENRLDWDQSWRRVDTFNERRHPKAPLFHISMACNHCADAPCMKACPAKAIQRDEATQAVILKEEHCLGCTYCAWVCPYEVPTYDEEKGVMGKCTLCSHRIKEGMEPACTSQCPTGALRFENLEEEELFHRVEGFPRTDIKPHVKIVPLRGQTHVPEGTSPPRVESFDYFQDLPPSKISLKKEWTLMIFTFLSAVGVSLVYGTLDGIVSLDPLVFSLAAVLVLGLSLVHLGKKHRAPRAVANTKESWLSREVLFVSLFALFSGIYLFLFPAGHLMGWIAALLGFMSLYSIDRVYRAAVKIDPRGHHSASVLLTGLFLSSVLINSPILILVFGSIKLVLYLNRKRLFVKTGQKAKPLLSMIRLVFGFLLPFVFWFGPSDLEVYLLASILVGELVDRCEYYDEFKILTPRSQMAIDLKTRLSAP